MFHINFKEMFIDIISDPLKSLFTSISGTIIGYLPGWLVNYLYSSVLAITFERLSMFFQLIVWTLTSIVAICSIINFIETHIEKWKKNKRKKKIYKSLGDGNLQK